MTRNTTLADLRKRIDEIDEHIVRLLSKRIRLAMKVARLKKASHLSAEDPQREQEIIDRLVKRAQGIPSRTQIVRIFESIFDAAKKGEQ